MDELKKYLQQHTDKMDFDEPSERIWNSVSKPTFKKNRSGVRILLKLAAAAVLLTGLYVTLHFLGHPSGPAELAVKTEQESDSQNTAVSVNKFPEPGPQAVLEKHTIAPPITVVDEAPKRDGRFQMMQSFKENYARLVAYQLTSIRSTPVYAEDPGYFDDFKFRLKQMDKDEMAIRKNIQQFGMSNNKLEQLINVYQQKLDVLKSLQAEINKMNERVNQEPEIDSTNKYYLNI